MSTTYADELLTAALEYAAMGYRVFPCIPGGKAPCTQNGFLDATTNEDQIEDWWTRWPEANIGVAVEGFYVLDLDPGSESWLADDPEKALSLTCGPCQRTPRKGHHYFYRMPEGSAWRRKTGKIHTGVDSLGEGGYVILAPSRIMGMGAYDWQHDNELAEVENLPYPPDWFQRVVESLQNKTNGTNGHAKSSSYQDGNPIPDGQRNSTLTSIAGNLKRIGAGRAEIEAAILQTNLDRCRPPLPTEEVQKIAWSVSRYEPDQVAVAITEGHFAQFVEPKDLEDEPQKPNAFPEHLLDVGGIMAEFCEYTNSQSRRLQPNLSLGAAIALMSVLVGRKVRDPSGTRTNAYVVNLAESGYGKNAGVTAVSQVFNYLERGKLVYEGGFHSESAIWSMLEKRPAVLAVIDEFGKYLSSATSNKAGTFLKRVPATWMSLFSQSGGLASPPASADYTKNTQINQPHLCILGASTQSTFFEGISQDVIESGFLPRILFFEGEEERPSLRRDVEQAPPPESLLERVKEWLLFNPGGLVNDEHPIPLVVEYTSSACDLLNEIYDKLDVLEKTCEEQFQPVWARCLELVRKLALIHACSIHSPSTVVVDRESLQWAWDVVHYQYKKIEWLIHEHMSSTEFEDHQQKVIRWLRRQPGKRATHTKMLRSVLGKLPRHVRNDVREVLLESGKVWSWMEDGKTKPTRMYSVNRDDLQKITDDENSDVQ